MNIRENTYRTVEAHCISKGYDLSRGLQSHIEKLAEEECEKQERFHAAYEVGDTSYVALALFPIDILDKVLEDR